MRTHFITAACLFLLPVLTPRTRAAAPYSYTAQANTPSTGDTVIQTIRINLQREFQTIHSFGASDCWTAKFAGQWKDEHKKNEIADLLFSTANLPDGSPKGIGLSMWRFNIGAGSFEQGAASGIADEYRREECFLGKDGSYNWSKQAGGQWFLKAAKKRGVKYLLAFTNSAPVQFTENGLSYGLASNNFSCKEDKYDAFSNFLVAVCKHFREAQLPIDYISPVNEPQWKWGEHASQEGSGSTNAQTARFISVLGPKIQAAGLSTSITASEAGQVNFLYGSNENAVGNQLVDFFTPSSNNYIGNIPNTEKLLSYHSYFLTCPDSNLFASRAAVNEKRKGVDPAVQLWQSEFGVLGDICGKLNGGPRNTDIAYGLYVAKVMYADLAIAGASSFQWWLAINPYNYSDGLVYINAPDGSMDPVKSKQDGLVSSSKQLWCMGNYARFVRPGMKRIAAALTGNTDCLVSAYKNEITKQLVTVIVNGSANSTVLRLQISQAVLAKNGSAYTTSATEDMKKSLVTTDQLEIKPMSVITLVASYK